MVTEIVILADGAAEQVLIDGVDPVSLAKRQCAQLKRARAARRGCANMPAGGLFDDVSRNQGELF